VSGAKAKQGAILGRLVSDEQEAESITQAGLVAENIRSRLAAPYLLITEHEGNAAGAIEHHCTASIGAALFWASSSQRGQYPRLGRYRHVSGQSGREQSDSVLRFA